MTTAQVVETSVTVNNTQPNEQTQPTYQVTSGFKPFTVLRSLERQSEPLANHKNSDTEDDYCRGCQPACEEDVLSRLASLGINGELAHRLVVETSVQKTCFQHYSILANTRSGMTTSDNGYRFFPPK